jgi:hypothetical protein
MDTQSTGKPSHYDRPADRLENATT